VSDFTVRPGTAKDFPLVYSATAKSLRLSPLYRDLSPDQWREIVHGLIVRMTTSHWKLTIATPTGFPTEVVGFVLGRPDKPAVGFPYTKEPYRRQGVARRLLEAVTQGRPDFLAVLAQPKVLGWCRDRGLKPQQSPYYL
jgi:GNAT superfamily N-acetyltransferase